MAKAGITSWHTKRIVGETQDEVKRRMFRACAMLEGEAKDLVSRGNRGGGNPSKAGEPPKVVSGTLRSNIGHEVKTKANEVVGLVGVRQGPADKYARRLELGFSGTDSKGRSYNQAERPYLRAALEKNEKRLLKFFE